MNLIESLLENATDYGKTSYELAKLKAVDKTADVVSSLLPHCLVLVIIALSVFLVSIGLAYWIGEILGKIYYGFFVIAAFYALSGILIHFFMHDWIKKCVSDNFIKQVLK